MVRRKYEEGACIASLLLGVAVKTEGGIMGENNNSRMSVLLLIHLMANRYNLVYIPLPDC